jgi:glycosyltransferase involved in cell wall biosynthesis
MTTATCVIPAYNEASRLPAVLAAVLGHPWVDQVLVVDDGSTDGTPDIARHYGAHVVTLSPNRGKSAAVAEGLSRVTTDIVLLIDADLGGLAASHVTDLLTPLRNGHASAAVSLRSNAPLAWRLIGVDYISGERAMFTRLLRPHLAEIAALRGFGLEVFLNALWLRDGCRIAIVPLSGVSSPSKMSKRGLWRGVTDDLRMMRDIFRTVGMKTTLTQILSLQASRVR